jgi:hypothetical protein
MAKRRKAKRAICPLPTAVHCASFLDLPVELILLVAENLTDHLNILSLMRLFYEPQDGDSVAR